MARRGREYPGQPILDFDFWKMEAKQREEERKAQEEEKQAEIKALKTYEKPVNDNQELFNLQADFYQNGNKNALIKMFDILNVIADKLVNKECRSKKLWFPHQHKEEFALDAAAAVIEQLNKNGLMIKTSFVTYLYLQVRKAMYNRTKARKLEDYSIQHNCNFMKLSDIEKQSLKKDFEGGKSEPKKNQRVEANKQLWLVDWYDSYNTFSLSFDGIHYSEYKGDDLKLLAIMPDGETRVMSFNKVRTELGFTPKQIEYMVQTGNPCCNVYLDELPEIPDEGKGKKRK